jgi:hypothetical protein
VPGYSNRYNSGLCSADLGTCAGELRFCLHYSEFWLLMMVTMKVRMWLLLFQGVVLLGLTSHSSYALFTPVDNYLLACGSSRNVTFLAQTYTPDSVQSSFSLKSQGNSNVANSSSAPFPIYQSARIFPITTSYKFTSKQEGSHWARLYF